MNLADRRIRWPLSGALGVIAIAVTALLAQAFIQGILGVRWVIHWFETVPVIALFFAILINRRLAHAAGVRGR